MERLPGIKQGDTFTMYVDYMRDGLPELISGLRSQVRDKDGRLICELRVRPTEIPGTYLLSADTTMRWPVGDLYLDIRRITDGYITTSETMVIPVIRTYTK